MKKWLNGLQVFGMLFALLVVLYLLRVMDEPKPPSVQTLKQDIPVYNGYSSYQNKGLPSGERYAGMDIMRQLMDEEPVALRAKDEKINIQLHYRNRPIYVEILHVKNGEGSPVIIQTTMEEEWTLPLPKDNDRHDYILSYRFEDGYVDYGFAVQRKD